MGLRFFMQLNIKILKRLIICISQITDDEIKEYYNLFNKVNLNILLNYVSQLKIYLLLARMYILNLDINNILKSYGLKHPFDFLNLDYNQCSDYELEYIINFYNFIIINIKKINVVKILHYISKNNRDKYHDIVILKKAKDGKYLNDKEFERLLYLKDIFREYRISYIIKKDNFIKIFNKIPNTEEVYQDIDENSNDRYLLWRDYRNVK